MLVLDTLTTASPKRPLDSISATFETGKIYTILGRTGAGKTELLRALAGLDPIIGGAVHLDGEDMAKRPIRARDMAMVYQQFINYPHLTVLDNVAFPLRRKKMEKEAARSKAREALAVVGLEGFEKRTPSELSGGQQQRVALARAIVKHARILLMDEPLANLDYKLREQLREEFPRLLHKNVEGIILYSTTEPAEAMQLGDAMIVMHEGRIIAQGPPAELFENPPSVDVARVISDPPISICLGEIRDGTLLLADGSQVLDTGLLLDKNGPVQVAIRPDALSIGGEIPARVTLSEFSGSDTIVHLDLPFGEVVMLVDGIQEFRAGDAFDVALDPSSLLLFSQAGDNITERTV